MSSHTAANDRTPQEKRRPDQKGAAGEFRMTNFNNQQGEKKEMKFQD